MITHDIQHWRNARQLRTHLSQHDPAICSWVKKIVIHHTYRPLQSQWQGLQSMKNIMNGYEAKGWTSAPHLFICSGSPRAYNDGIFQMNPLNLVGTHARQCNPTTWGIEVVGDYTHRPWDAGTTMMVTSAIVELLKWRNRDVDIEHEVSFEDIIGHRDCNPTTCPGDAINIITIRNAVRYAVENMYAS